MWNDFKTDAYQGTIAETTIYSGGNGDRIHTYVARPQGAGPYPGIVLVHHLPGWDEFYREMANRLANHGYTVTCPDLYCRVGHGTPDDMFARVRAEGGVEDDLVVADCAAAMQDLRALPTSNGKVGIIGTCSGGRHAFLAACRTPNGFDALVNLWGGRVVVGPQELTPKTPVAPIDYTKDLTAPVLGLFGNDDSNPSPDHVNQLEAELKKQGKSYEFHRYDGAGHGFLYYDRPVYRQEQAMDGWKKIFEFFAQHLKG